MPPRLQILRLARPVVSTSRPTVQFAQQRSASILSALSDNSGAYNKRIKRGRGPASGKGKTAGRGQKGQHAHGKVPAGFEGGQTPQWITNPERGRGKYNPFKVEMSPINLDRIQSWIDQGRLDPSKPITMKELNKSRCLHGVKRHGVKLLAKNPEALTTPINIIVSRASAEAIARIEALGGTITTRFYSPTSIKRVLRGDSHPVVSLDASPDLISLAASTSPTLIPSPILSALASSTDASQRKEALGAVMRQVSAKYKYRLPDATGRKDIEYYRDPAHRGYLAYTLDANESPSLFFKPPREAREKRNQTAKRNAAKASAENRLF
ncbi:50S ribosomal subunit protein L15 [Didymella exigua CBS 183.55]|uniref:50S ribosomal subunit protein L15 n=1 Tax=Didymella exigua CBS 183.55 TaxID=1150837 RepID=A0A6A5RIZ0_9PLEO|nr:50S ribosomal subunit protein L15 [Didymella exigua CBS 183.55]KAF1927782.1 50S ribosomal subunit protein L15 [Didymella exigua CBS 183.55]